MSPDIIKITRGSGGAKVSLDPPDDSFTQMTLAVKDFDPKEGLERK